MEKQSRFIRNVWLEGQGSTCFVIPSEIVKKLGINPDSMLYVELVDDLIVMKKYDHKLTKAEKIKSKTIDVVDTEDNHTSEIKDDVNPLDDVF